MPPSQIRVRVPSALAELVAGARVVPVAVEEPATVGAVLDVLAREHPVLERRVRDELGGLRTHVNLFVDADNVRNLDGLATPIAPNQELSIIPAVSGGCGVCLTQCVIKPPVTFSAWPVM